MPRGTVQYLLIRSRGGYAFLPELREVQPVGVPAKSPWNALARDDVASYFSLYNNNRGWGSRHVAPHCNSRNVSILTTVTDKTNVI